MNQNQSFNTVDPFEEQSILYLNSRTFQVSKDALKSTDPEAIHQYMKSMALQNPDKHLEEAKSVIDGGSKLLKTMESEANIKEKENIRGRRPELARKPSKFRMKPDISQSSTLVEPTLELDHIHDPREFFAAYDKFERTKKELRKARGEPDEVITFKPRQRRPELPRKKSVYKHYEYPGLSQNDIPVSQETLQDNIESQPSQSLQKESLTPNRKTGEVEEDGSISKSEGKVNKLFHELINSDIANLDENQALDFLKGRLNIKDVEIEDLDLPDFNEIPKVDFIGPVKTLIEDSNNLISESRAISFAPKFGTQKKLSDNHFQSFGSPTPPRSPFSAISEFGRNLVKSLVSKDPFSTHDVDSPGLTPSRIFGGGSSLASKDKVSATLDTSAEKKITETAIGDAPVVATLDDNVDTDIRTNEDMNENAEDMVQKSASVTQVNSKVDDITNDVEPHGVQDKEEENVEDFPEKEGSATLPEINAEVFEMEDLSQPGANSIESLDTSIPAQDPEIVPEQQNEEKPMKTTNKRKKTTTNKRKKTTTRQANPKKKPPIHAGQTDANSIEDMDTSIPTDIIHEQQDEEQTTMDNRKKTTQRKVDLKKKRQSLAGAGSSWTSGVRRSSRHTSRPLEFWKGERFLYGRVHNSLPTVIGVKYISPSKADFKVESFVSDEYKDLVDWAAFH